MSAVEDYGAYRENNIRRGVEYEDFVFDILREEGLTVTRYASQKWQYGVGECSGGIEVKFDDKIDEYERLYIEVSEKAYPNSQRSYAPSGIYRNDNSWLYVVGDYKNVYIFAKSILKLLYLTGRYLGKETPTSQGFVLPVEKAEKYAACVLRPGRSEQKPFPSPKPQPQQNFISRKEVGNVDAGE